MIKRTICLFLFAALALSVCACRREDPMPHTADSASPASVSVCLSDESAASDESVSSPTETAGKETPTPLPSGTGASLSETEDDGEGYVEKEINVFYFDKELNTTADVRFYGQIPYMSIAAYTALLYRGRDIPEGRDAISVTREGEIFTVTAAGGTPGVFDLRENTFETANFSLFKSTHFTEPGVEGCISYDAMPFIRVESVVSDREAEPMKIDFDDYGMRIRGDDGGVYLPIDTLSDMFACQNILVGAFNGKDLYVYCYSYDEQVSGFGAAYFDDLFGAPRSTELARYNYREFCLCYDRFLGRSGRSALERHYDLSRGVDAALMSDELGRELKRCLTSDDLTEYMAGRCVLGKLVADGGHSICDPIDMTYYLNEEGAAHRPRWLTAEMIASVRKEAAGIEELGPEVVNDVCKTNRYHQYVYEARRNVLSKPAAALAGRQTYTKVGDTAIIHIDGFMGEIRNMRKWTDYYDGKTDEIPFYDAEGGAVGAIYFGLKQANDDNVRRVVVDLSANTGGSTDEMLYMISLLTGHSDLHMRDRTAGQTFTVKYRIDRNLDRVFDEKDDEFDLVGGKEIAVLVSVNGFSCGGISPILLHEYGLYTLGENCGGGSCAIYFLHDAFGFLSYMSCPIQICTPSNIDIDSARLTVCDTFLPVGHPSTGGLDYSAFYDVETLDRLIDAHFSEKGEG